MFTIFKKEFKNFILTSFFWFTLAGVYVLRRMILYTTGGIDMLAYSSLAVFIVGLGVGILSNEFKTKTYRLLFSSPVKLHSIVLGKFLSLICAMFIAYLVSEILLIQFQYSCGNHVPIWTILFKFIAIFLIIGFFSSFVIFISSFSSHTGLVSSICFLLYFISTITNAIFSNSNGGGSLLYKICHIIWTNLFNYQVHFLRIYHGLFAFNSVFYFAIMIFSFLFLATKFLDKKWRM